VDRRGSRRVRAELAALPWLMRVGLLVVVVAGGADVLHHLAPAPLVSSLAPYLGRDGASVHALTLVGMVVTMAGVLTRRSAPARTGPTPAAVGGAPPPKPRRTEHAHR
jgi:hypothetical protein